MAINIKDPDTEATIRQLAAATGESITRAMHIAADERLARVRNEPKPKPDIRDFVYERARCLPVLDDRTPDEIIGYGPDGLFS